MRKMVNPNEKCLLCIQQFFKSPLTASTSQFLELSTSVAALIEYTSGIMKNKHISDRSCSETNTMIVNFTQMISCLEFLADIVKEEHKANFMLEECRKVALNRITFCLDIIGQTAQKNGVFTNESGQFLRWMDNALDCIAKINVDTGKQFALTRWEEAKSIYEDILAHAMSIAQICLDEDKKAITGSCRSVLDVLEDLQNELNQIEPNKAMVSLFVDNASNKLCSLERKVDVAVLRLSLFVFSQYRESLEKLHRFCESNCNGIFDQKELDNIITELDLHVDRIVQIGIFAVSCSLNIRSGNDIQNCMASLEFLEPELVPAMKMILKDNSSVNMTSAQIYKNYWMKEAGKLKTLVYEIIDPSAFCKVIYDEIVFEINSILEKIEASEEFRKSHFGNISNIGRVLIEFTLTVVRIEAITDEKVKNIIRKCNFITCEISSAIEVLDDNNAVSHGRILKRCRILQAEVKKLLSLLKQNDKSQNEDKDHETGDNGNEKKLILHEEEKNTVQNMTFSQIQYRGKEILENRSIMYRTPRKCYTIYTDLDEGSLNSLGLFSQRLIDSRMSFSTLSSNKNSSFPTNITDVLKNLSIFTTSFVGEQ